MSEMCYADIGVYGAVRVEITKRDDGVDIKAFRDMDGNCPSWTMRVCGQRDDGSLYCPPIVEKTDAAA